MPIIFEWNGYGFFFFSNEGDPLEPCHVHVRKGGSLAKYWVVPEVFLDSSWGMATQELNMLEKVIEEHKDLIQRNGKSTLTVEARAQKIWFDEYNMWIMFTDGRQLAVPLAYFPRLQHATMEQLKKVEMSGGGIGLHWDELDEDIHVPGLLLGQYEKRAL